MTISIVSGFLVLHSALLPKDENERGQQNCLKGSDITAVTPGEKDGETFVLMNCGFQYLVQESSQEILEAIRTSYQMVRK